MNITRNVRRTLGLGTAVLSLATAIGLNSTVFAGAPLQPQTVSAISSDQDHVDIAATRDWTKQELQAAVSYDAILAKVPNSTSVVQGVGPVSAAQPGATASQRPQQGRAARGDLLDASLSIAPSLAAETAALTQGAAADTPAPQDIAGPQSYPGAFTRYEVFTGITGARSYAVYPYTTQGKLFFTQKDPDDGIVRNYVCSASVMENGAIMTAGHCMHAGKYGQGGWSTNVVFVPAYKDGAAPLGQWRPRFLRVFTAWYANRDFGRDVAGAPLQLNNGQSITAFTGWLGLAWDWGYNQHYNAFGYPQAAPFNGQRLNVCQGSLAYYETGLTPATKAIGCDMTGGSSGGGWIMSFGSSNMLNGVNSYKRIINGVVLSQEMFSPHFDGAVKTVIWDCVTHNVGC